MRDPRRRGTWWCLAPRTGACSWVPILSECQRRRRQRTVLSAAAVDDQRWSLLGLDAGGEALLVGPDRRRGGLVEALRGLVGVEFALAGGLLMDVGCAPAPLVGGQIELEVVIVARGRLALADDLQRHLGTRAGLGHRVHDHTGSELVHRFPGGPLVLVETLNELLEREEDGHLHIIEVIVVHDVVLGDDLAESLQVGSDSLGGLKPPHEGGEVPHHLVPQLRHVGHVEEGLQLGGHLEELFEEQLDRALRILRHDGESDLNQLDLTGRDH